MIRTEDDIRAACTALEEDAPRIDDVLAAIVGRAPRRRRLRMYLAVAATVIVVAAVAIAALALPTRHHAIPAAPRPAAPLPAAPRQAANPALSKVDFTVVSPAGYAVAEYDSGALFQRVNLVKVQPRYDGGWATVTLYRPGGYDGATTGSPVTVNGHPGVIVADAHPTSVAYRATDPSQHQRAVVWQYAAGAWAMATGGSGRTDDAVDQANLLLTQAIRLGSTEIRVPMRLGFVPAGLSGENSTTAPIASTGNSQYGGLGLADATPPSSPLSTATWSSAIDIVAWTRHRTISGQFGCPDQPRTFTIGSNKGCYLTDHGATSGLLIDLHGHTVRIRIDAGHYGKYSDVQLVRILSELTFAPDVSDPATWFPARAAIS